MRFSTFCIRTRKSGSDSGGDGHVLDDRHGAARPRHPVQHRLHLVHQPPEQFRLFVLERLAGAEDHVLLLPQLVDQPMEPAADLQRVVAVLFHQQHGLGFGGDQPLETRLGRPAQTQVPAVHQIAGHRAVGEDVGDGAGGLLHAVQQQQGHAAAERQPLGAQRGLGHQGQRPLGADQQPRHVQIAVAEHVRQVVAAVVLRAFRLVLADQLGVLAQQGGQAVDEFPLPRDGAGAAAVAERLAAQFEHLPVGQHHLKALRRGGGWSRA